MNTCSSCKHYGQLPGESLVGICDNQKFVTGQRTDLKIITPDGVSLQNEYGSQFYVASAFGCIHHKDRTNVA